MEIPRPRTLPYVRLCKVDHLPNEAGIYFVLSPVLNKVLYIGMTQTGFRERWDSHHIARFILNPDSRIHYWTLKVSEEKLKKVEKEAIDLYNPTYNGRGKKYRRFHSLSLFEYSLLAIITCLVLVLIAKI